MATASGSDKQVKNEIPNASAVLAPEESQDIPMADNPQPTSSGGQATTPGVQLPAPSLSQVDDGGEADKKRKLDDAQTKKDLEQEDKYSKMVHKVLGDKLPNDTLKNIKKESGQLGRAIERYGKAQTRLENIRSRLSKLEGGEWPTGLKPFKLPIENTEADEVLGITELNIQLGPSMSIRDAREKVYKAVTHFYQRCDEKIAEYQVRNYKTDTDYKSYINKCMAPGDTMSKAVRSLGLDLPPGLFEPRTEVTEERATMLYKSVVELAAQQKAQDQERNKQLQMKREKLIADIDNMKPEELFERACRQAIGNKKPGDKYDKSGYKIDYIGLMGTNDAQSTSEMLTLNKNPDKNADTKRKWTKKELAQRKVQRQGGPNQKPKNEFATNQPSRYKESIPFTPKGKGKGKGKDPNTSKGKGKGKGKNKGKTKNLWIPKSPMPNMVQTKTRKGKGKGVTMPSADNIYTGFPKGKGKGFGSKGKVFTK